jgi:hypothetical protein
VSNADSISYCVQSASCHSECDGEIVVTVYGGVEQLYFFEWGSSGLTIVDDHTRQNLCAGNYSVLITDSLGNLVDFRSNIINEPSELGLLKSITNPSCFNSEDGEIDITTLGDQPFTWSWDNGLNTEDRFFLESSEYILTTTDDNGCWRKDTFLLSNPEEIDVLTISDTLNCIDFCNGTGIVIPQVGFPPFTYLWDSGQTNDTVTDLCFGTNNVTVADSNLCVKQFSVEVFNPDSLKIENLSVDSTCYNVCDGEISLDITGGKSPYSFEFVFDSQIIDSISTSIDNLCPRPSQSCKYIS